MKTVRWVVLCSSGKTHKLKTVSSRHRAQDFVTYYNYIRKPKCGPHRIGKGK